MTTCLGTRRRLRDRCTTVRKWTHRGNQASLLQTGPELATMALLDQTFESSFELEVLSELPPAGETRTYYYPGASSAGGYDGVMVRVTPQADSPWLGIFAFGHLSPKGLTGQFTMPDTAKFCVVAKGAGYIVDTRSPVDHCIVAAEPVFHACSHREAGLLILADYLKLVAYGAGGLAWTTARVSWDGIEIDRVTKDRLYGTAWSDPLNRQVEFVVDLETGKHEGGASPPT